MTTDEIKKLINELPEDQRKEIFAEKNAKLDQKDNKINKLTTELEGFKNEKLQTAHDELVQGIFTKGNVKEAYQESIKKLSDIQVGDDKSVIQNKLKTIKGNEIYNNFFNANSGGIRGSINNPSHLDMGLSKNDGNVYTPGVDDKETT